MIHGAGVLIMRLVENVPWVLLGLRENTFGSGLWSPPGGRVQPHETPEQAAVREVSEETGLLLTDISPLPELPPIELVCETHRWVNHTFISIVPLRAHPALLEPDNCSCWMFFPWDSLPKAQFPSLEHARQKLPYSRLLWHCTRSQADLAKWAGLP
jgi:8-oxo-dGTP diphosphatase